MLYFACDHAGFELKNYLLKECARNQIEVTDLTPIFDPKDDYPDEAAKLAKYLQNSDNFGVAICGTGQGICMAMNKFAWVRAGISQDAEVVVKMRQHNNANCLCLSGKFSECTGITAFELIQLFLNTKPDTDERHAKRVQKMSQLKT